MVTWFKEQNIPTKVCTVWGIATLLITLFAIFIDGEFIEVAFAWLVITFAPIAMLAHTADKLNRGSDKNSTDKRIP